MLTLDSFVNSGGLEYNTENVPEAPPGADAGKRFYPFFPLQDQLTALLI